MIKNKKIKRNWGLEDICILLWVISKYADQVGIRNIEKDLVIFYSNVEHGGLESHFAAHSRSQT